MEVEKPTPAPVKIEVKKEVVLEPPPPIVKVEPPSKPRFYSDAPAPTVCQLDSCCQSKHFLLTASQASRAGRVLLPLRLVNIKTYVRGATALTQAELQYYNPSRVDVVRDTVFSFPIASSDGLLMTKFDALIDDIQIQSVVKQGL